MPARGIGFNRLTICEASNTFAAGPSSSASRPVATNRPASVLSSGLRCFALGKSGRRNWVASKIGRNCFVAAADRWPA